MELAHERARGNLLVCRSVGPIGYVTEYRVGIPSRCVHRRNRKRSTGIWNEFSNTVAGSSVDNFAQSQITLLSNDTDGLPGGRPARVEPADGVRFAQPTHVVPTSMLECALSADTLRSCSGVLVADTPTDAMGKTTFTASKLGGHGRVRMTHRLANSFTHFGYVDVYLRSPDETGDGAVSLNDWSLFGTSYLNNQFRWWRDFDASGTVNLADWSFVCAHYNHACPTAPLLAAAAASEAGGYHLWGESSATGSRQFYGMCDWRCQVLGGAGASE
jgi:hypothetical protein